MSIPNCMAAHSRSCSHWLPFATTIVTVGSRTQSPRRIQPTTIVTVGSRSHLVAYRRLGSLPWDHVHRHLAEYRRLRSLPWDYVHSHLAVYRSHLRLSWVLTSCSLFYYYYFYYFYYYYYYSFVFDRRSFGLLKDYFASRKRQVPFSRPLQNMKLMHECSPKHALVKYGTARSNEVRRRYIKIR